jgi:hypothetical protein
MADDEDLGGGIFGESNPNPNPNPDPNPNPNPRPNPHLGGAGRESPLGIPDYPPSGEGARGRVPVRDLLMEAYGSDHEDEQLWTEEDVRRAKSFFTKYGRVQNFGEQYSEAQRVIKTAKKDVLEIEEERKKRLEELEKLDQQLVEKVAEAEPKRIMGARKSVGANQESPQVSLRRPRATGHVLGNSGMGVLGNQGLPMSINLVQPAALAPFDSERGDDPRLFLDKYEKMTVQLPDRMKVDGFGAYLTGAASDWVTVLESDLKQVFTLDDEGVQSNEWYELSWAELRKLFDQEFAEKKAKEIFRANQKSGETGITYLYRMVKLHQQSKLDLDEEQLATLIIQHMNDTFRNKFDFKNYKSLNRLRNDLRSFDEKRSAELVAKSKDKKRTSTMALLEAESDQFEKKRSNYMGDKWGSSRKADVEDLCSRVSALQKQLERVAHGGASGHQGRQDNRRADRKEKGNGRKREQSPRTDQQPRKKIECYNCGRMGYHIARECWSKPTGNRRNGKREFNRRDLPAIEGLSAKSGSGNSSRQEK